MDAKELRIGNWVEFHDATVQVDIISEYEPENRLVSKCTPIPLTEEWLLKFGLKHTVYGYKLPNHQESGRWIIYKHLGSLEKLEKPFLRFDGMCDVKYVHHLQNLYFALSGQELTVKELDKA